MKHNPCPLCHSRGSKFFFEGKRLFLRCQNCFLVFVPKLQHLSQELEKKEYDLHENNSEDEGYRNFLSRLSNPLTEMIKDNSVGLDFGCGPGPTLSKLLEQADHQVDLFDKFYFKDMKVFQKSYDFITATEVLEHLSDPAFEIDRLLNLLRPKGILGIMTKLVLDAEAFSTWHYKNDLTHISYFSKETFEWLANKFELACEFIEKDVIILSKHS